MRSESFLIKKFGENECGLADLPEKISSTTMSRFMNVQDGDYESIFPYRSVYWRTDSRFNQQRCWKRYRKNQWVSV